MTLLKNWGFRLVLLYGGFVVFMLSLVLVATRNTNDLVSDDYYDREISYESQIQQGRSAKALKEPLTWTMSGRTLMLRFPKSSFAPKGSLTLYRASNAKLDRIIPIAADAEGIQSVDFSTAATGMWRIQIQWEINGRQYYNEDNVFFE